MCKYFTARNESKATTSPRQGVPESGLQGRSGRTILGLWIHAIHPCTAPFRRFACKSAVLPICPAIHAGMTGKTNIFSFARSSSNWLFKGPRSTSMYPGWIGVGAVAAASLLLGGCVTDTQFLAQNSSAALRTAESRGKFELNCPQVTTSVLSQKVIQGMQGGYGWRGAGAWAGPWTEYTVGVRGCGRQAVYMTVCRDPDSCNAFSQTARILESPQ